MPKLYTFLAVLRSTLMKYIFFVCLALLTVIHAFILLHKLHKWIHFKISTSSFNRSFSDFIVYFHCPPRWTFYCVTQMPTQMVEVGEVRNNIFYQKTGFRRVLRALRRGVAGSQFNRSQWRRSESCSEIKGKKRASWVICKRPGSDLPFRLRLPRRTISQLTPRTIPQEWLLNHWKWGVECLCDNRQWIVFDWQNMYLNPIR